MTEDTQLSEIRSRIRIAWAVLRGWSVMKGVHVTGGDVRVHGNLTMSGPDTGLTGCDITSDGPIVIFGDGDTSGNYGDGLLAELPGASYREAREYGRPPEFPGGTRKRS
jgi:hypothetical protein